MKESLQELQKNSYLSGNNAAYIESLYEIYLKNPKAVEPEWQAYFQSMPQDTISYADIRDYFLRLAKEGRAAARPISQATASSENKQSQITDFINAYRHYGHYCAQLDPLGLIKQQDIPALHLNFHGLTEAEASIQFKLKKIYCGTIGFEYRHISDSQQLEWLQNRIESERSPYDSSVKSHILERLTVAEEFEKYLSTKYVGQKRFGLEGAESLIPLLDDVVQRAAGQGAKEIVIGMAHRGRLNVLINILGKSPQELFQEFEGKRRESSHSGDVKYHLGFSSDVATSNNGVHVVLAFNPSHLEIVGPVVEGSVRARQDRRSDSERTQVLPIVIHGDAAFAGQGVVMETLNLSQITHFSTGGTLHVVINNQVGFTTSEPHDARSTFYCTDVAKMIEAPIFHVNADDPEAVVFCAQLALDYRMTFKRDVVIDLVCYRRHGHNEADEPSATQPLMYKKIHSQPTTRKLYADKLMQEKVCSLADIEKMFSDYRAALDAGRSIVKMAAISTYEKFSADWEPFLNQEWNCPADTSFNPKQLRQLAAMLEAIPVGFTLQPQVSKMMDARRQMTAGKLPLNWGYAETLAYATLLDQGYSIRLCGQDSGRGTFAHRHAVLHDQESNDLFIPLKLLGKDKANFNVIDSTLSEEAVLAFEYGYATTEPNQLVIWEAQFGDFANGAQVVIDQFISSGEQKWKRLCGLTLFLPHGYEGQGPEHSSARLERFLQLCAEHNIQVCVPSTPAQIFHLIRRQMLRPFRKPLVVMTPKSLLRHKLAVSNLDELAKGAFQLVLSDEGDLKSTKVKRVVLCSGKVYYDLLEERAAKKMDDVAIIRVEQLYPFPREELTDQLRHYKTAKEIVWCQEEPKNQGAWFQIQHYILECLAKDQRLTYAGREPSAAPAVGYVALHTEQQHTLVKQALGETK